MSGSGGARSLLATAAAPGSRDGVARERLVTCDGLFHIYRLADQQVVALQGVDLIVDRGETVALLGPSGSGKSTLLSVLGGLERPSAGSVRFEGTDLARLPEASLTAFRRRRVGFIWQVPARNLLPWASAGDNVEFPMVVAGIPAGRRRRRAALLLEAVGLADARSRPVHALSGGEQQRLAAAVALSNNPALLLADEPTSQLDSENAARLVSMLREARDDLGTTIVLVTHDGGVAAKMDRTVRIRDGRVGGEGRGGVEYAVVGPTGSVHLPDHALQVLPPGSRAVVDVEGGRVVLRRTDENGAAPDGVPR